jgi:hypothetical protein
VEYRTLLKERTTEVTFVVKHFATVSTSVVRIVCSNVMVEILGVDFPPLASIVEFGEIKGGLSIV